MEQIQGASTPLISIGMPTYNGGHWIRASLESLLSQTFTDFELIVCDNASTDDTKSICLELAKHDSRIRYHANPENLGVIENYNMAVKLSRGKYFKWASCNDYCAPQFLASCIKVLEERPDVVLSFPRTRIFDQELSDAKDYEEDPCELSQLDVTSRYLSLRNTLALNNLFNGLIRAEVLKKTPLLKNFYSSDENLVAELILHGKFVQVDEPLFYRRIARDSAAIFLDEKEFRSFFFPNGKNNVHFPLWRLHLEYLAGIRRSPLSWAEKIGLYRHSLHWSYWEKGLLFSELFKPQGIGRKT